MERELVRAVLADEALIALTGYDRAVRVGVLDRAIASLTEQQCRIVRLRSPFGQPLNLRAAMDQVVGGGTGGAEQVELFFSTIAVTAAHERHIVLIVDDAQLLTSDLLSYLALIGSSAVGQHRRVQIILAGDPTMWDILPSVGHLAADRIVTRVVVALAMPLRPSAAQLEPTRKFRPAPVVADFPPAPVGAPVTPVVAPSQIHGHEGLRDRLAERHRRRERMRRLTSRMAANILALIFAASMLLAVAVLWFRQAEVRVAVRQWMNLDSTIVAPEPSAAAALTVRGNGLLAQGDVLAARTAFENAAKGGSASALTGLAKTSDPLYLADIGAHVKSDATLAVSLYRRAAALGDKEAAERLARLQAAPRR